MYENESKVWNTLFSYQRFFFQEYEMKGTADPFLFF